MSAWYKHIFTRGLGPLTAIWDKILKFETAMSSEVNARVQGSLGVLKLAELSLDFTELRCERDGSHC